MRGILVYGLWSVRMVIFYWLVNVDGTPRWIYSGESLHLTFENGSGTYPIRKELRGSFVSTGLSLLIPGAYTDFHESGKLTMTIWQIGLWIKRCGICGEQIEYFLFLYFAWIFNMIWNPEYKPIWWSLYYLFNSGPMSVSLGYSLYSWSSISSRRKQNTWVIAAAMSGRVSVVESTYLPLKPRKLIFTVAFICVALAGLPTGYALFSYWSAMRRF